MVVAAAAGSSSLPGVIRIGHAARWVVLVALLCAAGAWALPRLRPSAPPLVAAAALVGLAVLSTLWSVEPRTTFEKAVSLGLLFATCVLVATAAAGRPDRVAAVLTGLVAGAAVVGLLGLVVLAVDHGRAVQEATYEAPTRFQGFGQDPNTVGLLFAVAVPLATWALLRSTTARRRVATGLVLLLFAGTIVASGSRGALIAGAIGAAVVVATAAPRRWLALAAVVVALVAGAGIVSIPDPSASASAPAPAAGATVTAPTPRPGYLDAEAQYPLDADVGQPLPGGGQPPVRRGLFATSGRLDAWGGALHEAARRPVAGHGFGTEQDVFVDRYYRFVGGLPEDSYLGLALQLGIVGLLALLALAGTLVAPGLRALRGPRPDLAAAGLGVLAAGLAIAVVQSYLYSVGNIAASTLWIAAFLLVAVPQRG
jgi:O-antigen ligase